MQVILYLTAPSTTSPERDFGWKFSIDQLIGDFAAFAFQPSKFSFYEAGKPMFTSRRNLPPSKIDNSKVEDAKFSLLN